MNIGELITKVKALRPMRGLTRYSEARGGLLAGGIAYSGLFSLAAALTIGWTVFMSVLGKDEELRASVLEAISKALPGVLKVPGGSGVIDPDSLVLDSAITPASVIATAVLVWTILSVMSALATSIRAMFGLMAAQQKPYMQYLRSLGAFIVLACGILVSAGLSILSSNVAGFVSFSAAGTAGVLLGGWAIDTLVVAFLVRFLAAVRVMAKDLWLGSAVAALGLSIVRELGAAAVSSVSKNPLLVSFAAVITILFWLNLAARILLMSAAFMANPPLSFQVEDPGDVHEKEVPNYVTMSAPQTLEWAHNPLTGIIAPDVSREELPAIKGRAARKARKKIEKARAQAYSAAMEVVALEEQYRTLASMEEQK